MPPTTTTIDVALTPAEIAAALRDDVRLGLTATPKELPPKWFYDDRGCELFEQITRLPEYYPTETERTILTAEATAIALRSGADTVVELGSGTSDKTRTLLDAFHASGQLRRFVAFDVNESVIRHAAIALTDRYTGLAVHLVVGDFEKHLAVIPQSGTRMVAFLGSTIGNLRPDERRQFFARLSDNLRPGDSLLLGTDLVKEVHRLEAAYDDRSGVTAAFNKNVLHVVNRAVGATFDGGDFDHVARFDATNEWIEMLLRARRAHTIEIRDLDLEIRFEKGEEMRTEVSTKFRRAGVEAELAEAGLRIEQWMTDPAEDFAVSLARKV